jgi:pyruvate/2-oxoglutarate dehydrogenase complex dihydrolipoamide acyltransferase (E2) component
MRKPVHLPEISGADPVVTVWLASVGDLVYAGDRLLEILVEGAIIDITAPVTGTLVERTALCGDHVQSGQLLGTIEEE